jgi:hypothetical protein
MKKQLAIYLIMAEFIFSSISFAQSKKETTHLVTCETADVYRDNLAKSIAANILVWVQQGSFDTVASLIQENQKNPRDPGSVVCQRVGRKLNRLPDGEAQQIRALSDASKSYYLYKVKNKSSYWVIIQHR